MKEIKMFNSNNFAIVDDEDYPYLSRFKWHSSENNGNGVITTLPKQNGKHIHLEMWKLLVDMKNKGTGFKKEIVYKDKNNYNLQKENLVLVDIPSTLHINRKTRFGRNGIKPTSKYKGVSCRRRMTRKKTGNFLYTPDKPWRAEITRNGKLKIKYFAKEKDGAIWYNEMAKEFYGDFAYQNKIE